MKSLNQALLSAAAIALLTLSSCGKKEEVVEAPAPKPVAAVPNKAMAAVAGVAGMKSVVADTKAAIAAGDFTKATAAFGKFEGAWKTVEDGVKTKSPKVYAAVEDGMDAIGAALKSKDKVKATGALTALETAVSTLK
jgi:hypothetical protein